MEIDIQTVKGFKSKKNQTVAWSRSKTGYYIYDKDKGWAVYPKLEKVKISTVFPNHDVETSGKVDTYPDLNATPRYTGEIAKELQAAGKLSGVPEDASEYESAAMWKLIVGVKGGDPGMGLIYVSPEPNVEGCRMDVGKDKGKEKYDIIIWDEMIACYKRNTKGKKGKDKGVFVPNADDCLEAVIRATGYYHSNGKAIIASKTRVKKLLNERMPAHREGEADRWENIYPTVKTFQRATTGSRTTKSKVPRLTVDDITATLEKRMADLGMRLIEDGAVPK